jgi:TfoX/Sxy family transcriptional regulator of competence genes
VAFDDELAERIRATVHRQPGITERAMFGGLAFLVNGNLAVSASGQGGLLLRVDPADAESLVSEPTVRRFVMRGRQLNGWLHVAPDEVRTDAALEAWVIRGVTYARSLPAK